jgi:hypothetical protein
MATTSSISENTTEMLGAAFSNELIMLSPLLKHFAFQEEKEWRLVSLPKSTRDPNYNVRSSPRFIIPYFALSLEETDGNCVIDKIFIGPCPDQELVSEGVSGLVSRNQIKWKSISLSRIPFRA